MNRRMQRSDLLAETGAVEHAVMADLQLQVMQLPARGNVDAKFVAPHRSGRRRKCRPSRPSTVISPHLRIAVEIDQLAAMRHLALRQGVADEHRLDRLHVIGGVEVHHRHIFVVEVAVLLGRVAVARHQMVEHVEMGVDVAVEIHRHEAGKLEEARIDLPAEARIGERHACAGNCGGTIRRRAARRAC